MVAFLRTIPAALAALVLGAHFFRAGSHILAAACVAVSAASFVPRPASRTICRICLAAAAVEWLVTAWRIARVRLDAGQPHLRVLAILGAVAAFTAFASWLLPSARGAGALTKSS